ncbi:MAG TPA: hypothetical protein VMV76_00300 [Dehalococcoidia bacterium]|nr:hypothetical protein [Dehalococcoidia bacterium]
MKEKVVRSDVSEGGGGSQSPASPSFLVHNKDNVNAQLYWVWSLKALWDFQVYKGRIGRTHIVLNKREEPSVLRIMPASCKSRYFDDGRLYMSRRIQRRLGKYEKVRGLMETLTYDTKRIGKRDAWASFGKDTRRFLNGVNQYRKRRGWRRLHYLWVVEVQPDTGYPHVHIFFPNLKWLAPVEIINGNWRQGRANVEGAKKIKVNCAAYISKYLRKMRGWSDLHLALLWSGKCRMYGFSRGFSPKIEKQESKWQRWQIIESEDTERLERVLEEGGCTIEHGY